MLSTSWAPPPCRPAAAAAAVSVMAEEKPKGYLVITVIEAAGKNKDELYVWDTAEFEGYVKSG